MKERASFTLDKETFEIIEKILDLGIYRNKSHVVEHAIQVLGEKELNAEKEKKGVKDE